MRPFQRALATTVAGLAFAAAGIAGAAPAAATPEDGKGCVGARSIPETFVCVISVTPENVTPTATTTNVPVTVPEVCYFLDCVAPRTVVVPVPGVTPRTGVVATLWYRGQYIPINVGTAEVTALLFKSIDLATGTVNGAVGTAGQTVAYAVTVANGAAGTAYGLATSVAAAAVVTVNREVDEVKWAVGDIVDDLPTWEQIRESLVRLLEKEAGWPPSQEQISYIVCSIFRNVDPETSCS